MMQLQALMYPCRSNKYSYVIVTAMLSIMPGMMTLLPPSVKKFMGTSNIALKYGIILTGEVSSVAINLKLMSREVINQRLKLYGNTHFP